MKRIILVFICLIISNLVLAQKNYKLESSHNFETTVSKLKEKLNEQGILIFAEIDHSSAATNSGQELEPTTVFIVGNPKVGTALMKENQEVAIELPLKILVYERENKVWLVYSEIEKLPKKYRLKKTKDLPQKIDATMKTILDKVIH